MPVVVAMGCYGRAPHFTLGCKEIAGYVTSRALPYATRLFDKPLLSITKAMGDIQKKLQELSDSYQTFQGGV